MAGTDTSPRIPVAPFDKPDADIVIRSSDDVDFHVYKAILGMASPVFESMFTLPESPGSSCATPPVVTLTETATTVEHILRLCCPVPRSTIKNLEELVATSEAASKYEMIGLHLSLEQDLKGLLASGADPLRVYAIACLYRYNEVIGMAAKRTLDNPRCLEPPTMPPEFVHLSAEALFALMEYRRKCAAAALAIVKERHWIIQSNPARMMPYWNTDRPAIWKSWAWAACKEATDASSTIVVTRNPMLDVKVWYTWFEEDAAKAVLDQPKGEAVTRTSTLSRALEGAARCSLCAPVAWKDLLHYSDLLATRIDEAVSQVKVQLPF